ncbi:HNH endonuclease [Staphylococcus phage 355Saur083PP]|nr:HNH endonuclease [Staphylococcus phage 355Saur083PP]
MVENKINEVWKPIKKEYNNKYNFYVSNLGRVMINDRFSKIHVDRDGYLTVKINKKRCMVHRLVYEYFGTDFNKVYHIHHIDGNKQNNCIDNLECISPSEHNRRHHQDNTFNRYNRGYILSDDERQAIASKYKPYKYTVPMLAKEYNISESTVERIIKKYKKD